MDLVQPNNKSKYVKGTVFEKLLPPDSPNISDIFGEPKVSPRVGDEYQVEIPPMVMESERLQLSRFPAHAEFINVANSLVMGLPIPVMWINNNVYIHKNRAGFNNNSDWSVKSNLSLGSNNSKNIHSDSTKRCLKVRVESSNAGLEDEEELESSSFQPIMMGDANWDLVYQSKSWLLVPGVFSDSWNDFKADTFLLGVYIFGKNLVQVKRFMGSKEMGDILCFYYGKFYRSDGHQRWLNFWQMSKKRIPGHGVLKGWRHQELLSRLLPHVPEEVQKKIIEAAMTFAERKISLEEYVSTLKATVGISVLVKAVGIGKGKEDLTEVAMKPVNSNEVSTAYLKTEPGVISCNEGIDLELETTMDIDDPSEHQKHCSFKPQISTRKPNFKKLNTSDTSLAQQEKLSKERGPKSSPAETRNTYNLSGLPRATEGDPAAEPLNLPDFVDMSLTVQNNTNPSNHARDVLHRIGSKKRMQNNLSKTAKKWQQVQLDQDTSTSSGKQRKLTACGKVETSSSKKKFIMDPALKVMEPTCMFGSPNAYENAVSPVDLSLEKVPSGTPLAEKSSPDEESSRVLPGNIYSINKSPQDSDECLHRPLFDLNLPATPPDSEDDEFSMVKAIQNQENPNAQISSNPPATNMLIEDSEALKTSVNDSSAQEQTTANTRRQSTRNRALTIRALEAIESEFSSTKRRRKNTERSSSRVIATLDSDSTDAGIVKERNNVDGGLRGETNMSSDSFVEMERKAVEDLVRDT